jgi:hypothetical protein
MKHIFIVYLIDIINVNIFLYIFGQTLGTLTEDAPRIVFFRDIGSISSLTISN